MMMKALERMSLNLVKTKLRNKLPLGDFLRHTSEVLLKQKKSKNRNYWA